MNYNLETLIFTSLALSFYCLLLQHRHQKIQRSN